MESAATDPVLLRCIGMNCKGSSCPIFKRMRSHFEPSYKFQSVKSDGALKADV
jgi:hypothetical protein